MKIEKITKMNHKKYKIKINENELVIYDDVILKYKLLGDKEISEDDLNDILNDNRYYEMYNSVLKYINTRLRSEFEINKFLNKKKLSSKVIKEIVEQLQKEGYINDKVFAEAYINDKLNFTTSGLNKIKNELIEHNIDEMLINNLLSTVDKDSLYQKLEKLIIKKIKLNKKYSKYHLQNKILYDYLTDGYDREDIIEIFENNYVENNDLIKKEYNILKQKLSSKYSGNQLEYKIKEKLYQKGFDISALEKG